MAVTKIWKIKGNLKRVINYAENIQKTKSELLDTLDYAMNKDKTEQQYFVSGLNCEPEDAYVQMQDIKKMFGKEDKILGYHAYQSFKGNEVTPEVAHEIGLRLANELWGNFQVVVTTHLNTDNIHNHFVINSVSFLDGKKFYDNRETYAKMRHISDELCAEYGACFLKEKQCKKSKINYANYYKKYESRSNYTTLAKKDLDKAIAYSYSYSDFFETMQKMGYEIFERYGRISIRRDPYKRNIRIERAYGEFYTIENIKQRILREHSTRVPFLEYYSAFIDLKKYKKRKLVLSKKHYKKVTGFKARYLRYVYLFRMYKVNPNIKITKRIREEVAKLEAYSKKLKFLFKNNIEKEKDLEIFLRVNNEEIFKINSEIKKLRYKIKSLEKISKNNEEKFLISQRISELNEQRKIMSEEINLAYEILYSNKDVKDKIKEQNDYEIQEKKELEKQEKRKKKLRNKKEGEI